jgi:hypothetical protein
MNEITKGEHNRFGAEGPPAGGAEIKLEWSNEGGAIAVLCNVWN